VSVSKSLSYIFHWEEQCTVTYGSIYLNWFRHDKDFLTAEISIVCEDGSFQKLLNKFECTSYYGSALRVFV
jgi:hypothetical protein